jgi:hypothetical protein
MKNTLPKKQTRAEAAYVRDMARTSALKKIDRGQAWILSVAELPEPLKRFATWESSDVHIRLPAAARRRFPGVAFMLQYCHRFVPARGDHLLPGCEHDIFKPNGQSECTFRSADE